MEAGKNYSLKVLRQTNIGYMLEGQNGEIFLHNREVVGTINEGDVIDVFLYFDSQKRLAATMQKALVSIENPGWVTVKGKLDNQGIFVNIGINKDALISKDFLPYDYSLWPIEGDELFCILKNKGNRLNAKIVNHNEFDTYGIKAGEIEVGSSVSAYVTRINNEGICLFTKEMNFIMVHKTQMRQNYRLGSLVTVRILDINERGIHGTFLEKKEDMIDGDSQIILEYLKEHLRMPYTSNTEPETIIQVFKMSKKAFKRAIGHLYKERLIMIYDEEIVLKKD